MYIYIILIFSACFTILAQNLSSYIYAFIFLITASLIQLLKNKKISVAFSLRYIIIFAILLRVIFVMMGPSLSDDYFRYIWDGNLINKLQNPYTKTPIELFTTQNNTYKKKLFSNMNSQNYYSCYPPISQIYFAASSKLASAFNNKYQIIIAFYILKILFGLSELLLLYVLYKNLSEVFFTLYALNPLIVLETWGQPHTDSLAMICLALTLIFLKKRKIYLPVLLLTLATWVKIWPVLLLPYIILNSKKWKKYIFKASALSIALSILIWLPFYETSILTKINSSLALYTNSFEFNGGFYHFIKIISQKPFEILGIISEKQDTSKIIAPLLQNIFLSGIFISYIIIFIKRFPVNYEKIFILFLIWFYICSSVIHPWYFLSFFAVLTIYFDNPKNRDKKQYINLCLAMLWVAVFSFTTYLHYSNDLYTLSVSFTWIGALIIYIFLNYYKIKII